MKEADSSPRRACRVPAGRIWYLIGKSASGKDSIYRELLIRFPSLKTCVMYTTRPMREHEEDGVTYHFTDQAAIDRFASEGKLIEARTYNTVYGPWTYTTVDDGQIDLTADSYLMTGTLESFQKTRDYFGKDAVQPLYIEVEDGERLLRAVRREMEEKQPKYTELCRRFIADAADFSEERIQQAGITRRYSNMDKESCLREIAEAILGKSGR